MEKYSVLRAREKVSPTKLSSSSSVDHSDDEIIVSSGASSSETETVYLKDKNSENDNWSGGSQTPPWYILQNSEPPPKKINNLRESLEKARKLGFEKFIIQNSIKKCLPKNRACNCLKRPLSKKSGVTVHRSKKYGTCHYGNLFTCSLVWVCPICGAKVSERRRQELMLLDERHAEVDGRKLLVTLTFPHGYQDELSVLLERLKVAKRKLGRDRSFKKLWKEEIGRIGWVQALEVTHGYRNGWHPHIHELWLVDNRLEEQEAIKLLEEKLYPLWRRFCIASDLPEPSKRYGVDIRNGDYASSYIAKWGIEEEMTKGHIKTGRKGNRTPWDFLRDIFLYDDEQSKILFREYVKAFKGKQQLRWSPGLKKLYGIDDKKDEQLAREQIDEADMLGRICWEDWKLILRYETRWNVLYVAKLHGWVGIEQLIDELRVYASVKS